jgi:hypothetical protein
MDPATTPWKKKTPTGSLFLLGLCGNLINCKNSTTFFVDEYLKTKEKFPKISYTTQTPLIIHNKTQ